MRFFRSFSPLARPSLTLLFPAVLCGAGLVAGCGGGSSNNNVNSPQIRAVFAVSNGGNGTISVNGTQVAGSQSYFGASSYQSLGNSASSVTFSLSSNSSITYPAVAQSFSAGSYYSLVLVGRGDITSASDPRYPSVIIASDNFSTPSTGQSVVRILQAAPDAGNVDVLINGAAATSGAAYKSVSGQIGEPSGNVTIQVNQAGTNTILVSPQTVNLTGGHVYTIFVVEPTVSPTPIYGLQETDDTATALSSL